MYLAIVSGIVVKISPILRYCQPGVSGDMNSNDLLHDQTGQ
jgi:hypothetical protein